MQDSGGMTIVVRASRASRVRSLRLSLYGYQRGERDRLDTPTAGVSERFFALGQRHDRQEGDSAKTAGSSRPRNRVQPASCCWPKRKISGSGGSALVVLHICFLPQLVRSSYAGLHARGAFAALEASSRNPQPGGSHAIERIHDLVVVARRSVPAWTERSSRPPSRQSISAGSPKSEKRISGPAEKPMMGKP